MLRPFARFRAHMPTRPRYLCSRCGARWPCAPARLRLLTRYRDDPAGLLLHLGAYFYAALVDQPRTPPADLTRQMFGWVPDEIMHPDP
ncbi:hypothetical protein [Plantactinospora sp. WMMB782]|uniref:hypothetical protein n=1 Tax=Plantactinospora sp. WMMB782 TaxID=3404121 RepID=UPI003B95DA5C